MEKKTTGAYKDTLVIDIETFAGEKPDPSEIKAPSNYKSEESIKKYQEANADKEWRKQALSSINGRVWCIGYALNDEEPGCLTGNTEKDLMFQFDEMLSGLGYPTIVAHNGLDFDFLFLFHRALKYGCVNIINKFGEKSSLLVDTMKIMDGPSWKKMTSLDNMCKLLGVEGKGDVDGSMVHDMVLAGEYDKITEYCIHDVVVLKKCYLKLKEYGLC
jgi:DNA polymerase elongation subunit (family B)